MRALRLGTALAGLVLVISANAAEKLFDPARNPATDLQAAEKLAHREHKNILMDVGGNWCPWCILLDRTLTQDAELHGLLEKNYVVLLVNWSQDNQNQPFLSAYPRAVAYPAWYVLSPDGRLLKTEDTSDLEQSHKLDAGYNKDALKRFLTANAPK